MELEKLKESPSFFLWWKSNIKPYKWYSCTDCNYHFRCNDDLIKHQWIYHNKGKGEIYTCNLCNKQFKIKKKNHMKSI